MGVFCGNMKSVKDSLDQSRREMRRQRQFLERLTFSTDIVASTSASDPTQQASTEDVYFEDLNLSVIEGNCPGVYEVRTAVDFFTVGKLKEENIDLSKSDERTRAKLCDKKISAIKLALEQRFPNQWEQAKNSINQNGLGLRKPPKINVQARSENEL